MNHINKPYPSTGQAFVFLLIFWGFNLVSYVVIYGLFFGFSMDSLTGKESGTLAQIAELLTYITTGVLSFIIAMQMRRSSGVTSKLGFKKAPFNIYISASIVVLCFGYMQDIFSYLFPMPDMIVELFEKLNNKSAFTFIMIVVAAPILEELIFRGVILDGLLMRYKGGKAVLISALIFGIMHGIPWQVVPAFFAGLLFGWLYWKTRSLILTMVLHAINNFAATVYGWIFSMSDSQTAIIDNLGITTYLVGFVMALLIIIGTLRYMNRYFRKVNSDNNNEELETADLPV